MLDCDRLIAKRPALQREVETGTSGGPVVLYEYGYSYSVYVPVPRCCGWKTCPQSKNSNVELHPPSVALRTGQLVVVNYSPLTTVPQGLQPRFPAFLRQVWLRILPCWWFLCLHPTPGSPTAFSLRVLIHTSIILWLPISAVMARSWHGSEPPLTGHPFVKTH